MMSPTVFLFLGSVVSWNKLFSRLKYFAVAMKPGVTRAVVVLAVAVSVIAVGVAVGVVVVVVAVGVAVVVVVVK